MYQRPTSFNLAMQISKYTFLGIDFYEVLRSCTQNPALVMGRLNDIGTLSPGTNGDVAIFKRIDCHNEFGDRPYYDSQKVLKQGNEIYKPLMTIKKGKIVYRICYFKKRKGGVIMRKNTMFKRWYVSISCVNVGRLWKERDSEKWCKRRTGSKLA